jgi:hypothetical protein
MKDKQEVKALLKLKIKKKTPIKSENGKIDQNMN